MPSILVPQFPYSSPPCRSCFPFPLLSALSFQLQIIHSIFPFASSGFSSTVFHLVSPPQTSMHTLSFGVSPSLCPLSCSDLIVSCAAMTPSPGAKLGSTGRQQVRAVCFIARDHIFLSHSRHSWIFPPLFFFWNCVFSSTYRSFPAIPPTYVPIIIPIIILMGCNED